MSKPANMILFILPCLLYAVTYPRLEFNALTTADGLSDNAIFCVQQDREGFIWIGTQNGLNLYDGYQFRIFRHNPADSTSISANHINCLLVDGNELWIGTDSGGLDRYNRLTGRFIKYRNDPLQPNSLLSDFVSSLCRDSEGNLWVGTSEGVSRYNRATDDFEHLPIQAYVKAICQDIQGRLWFGTGFDGLFEYEPDDGQIRHFIHHPGDPASLSVNTIETIVHDTAGKLWIGTIDGGLNVFDPLTGRFQTFTMNTESGNSPVSNTIYCLYQDGRGNLWAGFENAGLYRINTDIRDNPADLAYNVYRHDANDLNTLSNNTVRSIFEDQQGNLWVGTYYGGINLHRRFKKPFVNYQAEPFHDAGLNHNIIQTVLEDHSQLIWIGTDGGGINIFNPRNGSFRKIQHDPENPASLSDNHILDLCENSVGAIWVATWNGLNVHLGRGKFRHYFHRETDPASLINNKVTAVLEDSARHVWVGTTQGLTLFTPPDSEFVHFDAVRHNNIDNRYVHTIFQDSKLNIWIGTVHGLYFLDYNDLCNNRFNFTLYLHDESDSLSIPVSHFLTVYEDSLGVIWLGTTDGLCRFDVVPRRFKLYSTRNGLAGNSVFSIIQDNGCLWLGTSAGITRFDPVREEFKNYGVNDGVLSDAFTKAVCRTSRGELIFGGKTGFTRFDPVQIKESPYIPPVVVNDFQIFDRPVHLADIIRSPEESDSLILSLKYNQNMISFEFSALDFTAPKKNLYRYMLYGFDASWRYTDAGRRFATYTNVPPGQYVFRVQGSNSDGLWNYKGKSIGIIIHPPFWRTRWAWFIYGLFLFSILMLFRRLVIYREKLRNEMIMERREAERIHELDAMKLRFFTNISHEFRTPLTLIIGLLERLMRMKGKQRRSELVQNYHILQRNAKRLLRLINQIMDIRKLDENRLQLNLKHRDAVQFIRAIFSSFKYQAEQRNISYRFESNADHFYIWFDPDKVEKIIYNLISNAFKYTKPEGSIHIRLTSPNLEVSESIHRMPSIPMLEILVEDTGTGMAADQLGKIFQPFFQIPSEENVAEKGTGIGLTLTRELIDLHQGYISVESLPGVGSCFKVLLPANLIPQSGVNDAEPIEESLYPVLPETETDDIPQKLSSISEEEGALILIVDDDLDFCLYLKDELSSDYRVIIAVSGKAALDKSGECLPDLIISDVRMPEMDGFTLCRKLKANEKTNHIPFILLTSQTREEHQMDGFDCGADDYIIKPFDVIMLRKRIANLLDSRKKLKERFSHEIYLQPSNVTITSEDERFLMNVFQVIEAHLEDSEYTISQLGRDVGLSRVQLYRKIKALAKITPNDLLKNFRLKRAAQLLKESHLTVFEIAYRVGFKDPSYFCKCFKQFFSMSPTEYVKHQTSQTDAIKVVS